MGEFQLAILARYLSNDSNLLRCGQRRNTNQGQQNKYNGEAFGRFRDRSVGGPRLIRAAVYAVSAVVRHTAGSLGGAGQ